MKTNREIRSESLKRVLTGKWFWRILIVSILLGSVNDFANKVVAYIFREFEIQTWFDYLIVKLHGLASGVECEVPSRAIAMQMNNATAFMLFTAFIFGGIALFGMTAVVLKSAKQEDRGWFRDSFAGFARPLGLAWLGFLLAVLVTMWSLLLVIPGIVASYSYSQCWNLKVENPDWSAGRCLAESARMMKGHRLQRFRLDMFFVVACLAIMFPVIAAGSSISGFMTLLLHIIALPLVLLLGMWMSVSRAVFYKALLANSNDDAQTSSASIESQTSEPRSVSL